MNAALVNVVPAGEILAEELEARAWSQADFAEILGRPAQFVSEIISGKKEITRESAAQIGAALGTSPEVWLNIQDSYYLWRQSHDMGTREELDEVRLRVRLREIAPVAVLRKRGVITESSTRGQAEQVMKLFRLRSIDDTPELPMAARRSNHAEQVSPAQITWLACVRQKAEALQVGTFNPDGLCSLAEGLSRIVADPLAFTGLPELFANVGVRLAYVEAFPSSKLDGASFLLEDGTPVIGLSGRGRRLDKVLFTLLHEAAHVALGHVNDHLILDDEGQHTLGEEQPANELAAQWILPEGLPSVPARISQSWVTTTAKAQGVHPVVILGRLQNAGLITWRSALIKGAPSVTEYLQTW